MHSVLHRIHLLPALHELLDVFLHFVVVRLALSRHESMVRVAVFTIRVADGADRLSVVVGDGRDLAKTLQVHARRCQPDV